MVSFYPSVVPTLSRSILTMRSAPVEISHSRTGSNATRRRPSVDYDWGDWPSCADDESKPNSKRRRGEDTAARETSARLSTLLPSLSRRWKNRKEHKPDGSKKKSMLTEALHEVVASASRSRASSLRAPSVDAPAEAPPLPRPHTADNTHRMSDVVGDGLRISIDVSLPEDDETSHDGPMATTPLLPPALADLAEAPVQSPLESPTVASPVVAPINPFDTPHPSFSHANNVQSVYPTPPLLASRPSVASFNYQRSQPASPPMTCTAEHHIPPIDLAVTAAPTDAWATLLGHANFHIHPAPYRLSADSVTPTDLARLGDDFQAAELAFSDHLARTAAHYSTTSKVYALTLRKWASLAAEWHACLADAHRVAAAVQPRPVPPAIPSSSAASASLVAALREAMADDAPPAACRVLPKFPSAGEKGIVGPMTRVGPRCGRPRRESRTKQFWRFLTTVWPQSVVAGR